MSVYTNYLTERDIMIRVAFHSPRPIVSPNKSNITSFVNYIHCLLASQKKSAKRKLLNLRQVINRDMHKYLVKFILT